MSRADLFKWLFSFYLLSLTVGWGIFTVLVVKSSTANPTAVNVVEAAGAGVLMGSLITWDGLVIQHWFRKKNPEEGK